MRRREFITLLPGAVAAWPPAASGQQGERVRRIGVLMGAGTENDPSSQARLSAFRNGLQELGWTEGRNVRFEIRWAEAEVDRMRAFAADLVKLPPDVILSYGTPAIAALKAATASIPIVF